MMVSPKLAAAFVACCPAIGGAAESRPAYTAESSSTNAMDGKKYWWSLSRRVAKVWLGRVITWRARARSFSMVDGPSFG